ncbi:MAG: hypothetical protein AB8B50_03100, partial [Pirellulaceae bacterium]
HSLSQTTQGQPDIGAGYSSSCVALVHQCFPFISSLHPGVDEVEFVEQSVLKASLASAQDPGDSDSSISTSMAFAFFSHIQAGKASRHWQSQCHTKGATANA